MPKLWWSPSQGLITEDRGVLVRIMTADQSRPMGGRVFRDLPDDAYALRRWRDSIELLEIDSD